MLFFVAVYFVCLNVIIGVQSYTEKSLIDDKSFPDTTSGRVSNVLLDILNQESLVRFSMVQKIQNLVMDVIDNKNSTRSMKKRLNDVIKELQSSEEWHQKIRRENLELQEELLTFNETLIENQNRTMKIIQSLNESEINFLKRQTLDLQRKNQALTNENMEMKSRIGINYEMLSFVNNSQTELKDEIQELKTAIADRSRNDKFLRNKLQDLRNKSSRLTEEFNRMNKTQYKMLKNMFESFSVAVNESLDNIQENVNQSISQLSDKLSIVALELRPGYCYDLLKRIPSLKGKDDVYKIYIESNPTPVFCDMTTDGGGWTVLQKRIDGSTEFYRTLEEYKKGFGDPKNNYWIGIDAIHALTKDQDQELRVDLQRFNGDTAYAEYSTFYIGNETDKYRLTVSGFTGTAGDSLAWHSGMKFTAKDQDNDSSVGNCAVINHGAWWYNACNDSNLNGLYGQSGDSGSKYPAWYHWKHKYEALKQTMMMIRHKN